VFLWISQNITLVKEAAADVNDEKLTLLKLENLIGMVSEGL